MQPIYLLITDLNGSTQMTTLPHQDAVLAIEHAFPVLKVDAIPRTVQLTLRPSLIGVEIEAEGLRYKIPLAAQEILHLRTGDGNDQVLVESALPCRLVIETQGGDDRIDLGDYLSDDTERTGNVMVDAGPGNDQVTAFGPSKVEIDGGAGDDRITSSAPLSMLYAGPGNDTLKVGGGRALIEAMSGHNQVSTGRLDDRLFASAESVQAIEGHDAPLLFETSGSPLPDDYANTFTIVGSPHYRQKITRLLQMLRATSTASQLLADLVAANASIVISDTALLDNATTRYSDAVNDPRVVDGQRGKPVLLCKIDFNPLAQALDLPAPVILYHELCHAWNAVTGSVLGDREHQVVGLVSPVPPFDFDDDPSTPPTTANPDPYNENALRQELGLPPRLSFP